MRALGFDPAPLLFGRDLQGRDLALSRETADPWKLRPAPLHSPTVVNRKFTPTSYHCHSPPLEFSAVSLQIPRLGRRVG
jgi:hypothetical protein